MAGERGHESGREWHARTWVVDAANVIGARPDRWWRDRTGAATRLYDRILRLPAAGPPPIMPDPGVAPGAPGPRAAGAPAAGGAARGRIGPVVLPERVVLVLEGAARAGVPAGTVWLGRPAPEPRSGGASELETPPERPREEPQRPSEALGGTLALTVVHAPGSGDDAVVEAARAAARPVLVVTSDRGLRERLAEVGAQVVGAGEFRTLLDAVGDAPPDSPDRGGPPG